MTDVNRRRRRAWPPSLSEATVIAWILAVTLWTIAIVTVLIRPGLVDMFGHLKGTDFIQFYAAGTIVRTDRPNVLYDHAEMHRIQVGAVPESEPFLYLSVYPPQSAVIFAPLSQWPYGVALTVWILFSAVVYGSVTALAARGLSLPTKLLIPCLAGFPPFWQLVLHGGSTAWPLAAFGFGGAALIGNRRLVAGLAFGLLALKPQLGLVLAVILIAGREWRIIAGIALSWAIQLGLSVAVVGVNTWSAYLAVIRQLPELRAYLEPETKAALMHSINGLVSLPDAVEPFVWVTLSAAVVYRTLRVWRSHTDMAMKMGALVLASILVSPHVFTYDATLLALAVLWMGRTLRDDDARDYAGWVCLLVITLLVPTRTLIGIQLSVVVMLWILFRATARRLETVNAPPRIDTAAPQLDAPS